MCSSPSASTATERSSSSMAGEGITIAREHQDRAGDPAPVLDPQTRRRAGAMQRIAEQDEPRRLGVGGDHAGDAAAEGVSADHRARQARSHLIAQRAHGSLGRSPRAGAAPTRRCRAAAAAARRASSSRGLPRRHGRAKTFATDHASRSSPRTTVQRFKISARGSGRCGGSAHFYEGPKSGRPSSGVDAVA